MAIEGDRPQPFASDENGRGKTLEEALNNALEKKGASHGQVFAVQLFVSVANPHVGEYIVRID